MAVSAENKSLAKYLASVFGGAINVFKYWDDNHQSGIDVLSCPDKPNAGVTSYGTLGLSDYSIGLEVEGIRLGAEVVMAAGSQFDTAPNILATCAFNVINSEMACRPGIVFPRVVEMYRPKSEMKHILFLPPFLWELKTQQFPKKKVAWLLAVPIADREFEHMKQFGVDALETVFTEKQIDIFDLDRQSVI